MPQRHGRFRYIGIQKRIMLYVMVGLVLMFAVVAFLGLHGIQQATDLVYEERLNTAYTIGGILQRSFEDVANDVREATPEMLGAAPSEDATKAATRLFEHLTKTDSFPFFRVVGLWVLAPDGTLRVSVGAPVNGSDAAATLAATAGAMVSAARPYTVLPAQWRSTEHFPFATVLTRLGDSAGDGDAIVAVHTASLNSNRPYFPPGGAPQQEGATEGEAPPPSPDQTTSNYHLEIVNYAGIAVLGIGDDERPGEPSRHFPVIRDLMAARTATALLHEPSDANDFEAHIMAVVPVGAWPFYLVLEQPADVALALPSELRQRLIVFMSLGFTATLLVAWVTTAHVVGPSKRLMAAARRMAEGDLDSPVNVHAQDEIGRLAESLDSMRDQLRIAREQIESANRELESRVRERTARLGELVAKVISAQEEERRRVARELHDETAQTLGALSIALDRALEGLEGGPAESAVQVAEARALTSHLLTETRRLIFDLRPMVLDDLGLAPAIRWYAETRLQPLGVMTTIEVNGAGTRLPSHIEGALFRIVQEAINNIARHAEASSARIRLVVGPEAVAVHVADDGKGFDVDRTLGAGVPVASVGLRGVSERVALLNGTLDICSEHGKGTEIAVRIPIGGEGA